MLWDWLANLDSFRLIFIPTVIAAVICAIAEYKITKTIKDPNTITTVALTTGGFFSGLYLIWVAFVGDISKLPEYWEATVFVAGWVSAIYCCHKIIHIIQNLRSKSAQKQPPDTGGANNGNSEPPSDN